MIEPVLAYLDPGTGATLVQLALAGTAGVAAATKLRMSKLKRRVASDTRVDEESPDDEETVEEASAIE